MAAEGSPERVIVTGDARAALHLGGEEPVVYEARFSGIAKLINGEWVAKDLVCNRSLPGKIGYSEVMRIAWSVTGADGNAREAGVSTVPLYLLRQTPEEGLPLLHTPVHLACREAAGLDDDARIM